MISLGNDDIMGNVFYVVIPILKPHPVDYFDKDVHEKILNEIGILKGSYIVDDVTIEYESVPCDEKFSHIIQRVVPTHIRPYKMFVFQVTVSNATHLLKSYDGLSAGKSYFLSILSFIPIFSYSLAYSLGVYCYGVFDVDDFLVYYSENTWGKYEGLKSSFSFLYKNNEMICCSSTGISLQKILNWFLSVDDVIDACGKTALGKSLSIYSRMFSSNSEDEDVFMSGFLSFIALEALYESHGIINDLSEKMSAFLNVDESECKHDVKLMYKHRSSVAHGGFKFPFKFNPNDGSEFFEKSLDKTWKSFDLGLRYLFKSYTKMILENRKDLPFAKK